MTQPTARQLPWSGRARTAAAGGRSATLPLLGITAGFVLAGVAGFRAAPPPVTAVPPGYVALVNQKGILTSDFISQVEADTGKKYADATAAERRNALHAMVDEELLVQRGLVLDVPETTTEVRDTITRAVNAQVDAPLLELQPADAQLRAYYNSHLAAYTSGGTMAVHDLVLRFGGYQDADQSEAQGRADAADAVYQLRSGASIEHVMEHFGLVESGRTGHGEELEFAARLHLGDRLYALAGTLADGEISDPVADTDGIHILIMDHRRPPAVAPFSSVRDKVYTDYRQEQNQHTEADNLRTLRSQARILLAPGQSE